MSWEQLHEFSFALGLYGRHAMNEQLTIEIGRAVVCTGDTVFDLGANHGDVTIPMAEIVGPTGTVHAFEPNRALWQNLLAIGPQVCLWPVAAGNQVSVSTLHLIENEDGLSSLLPIAGAGKSSLQSIIQVPLDQLAELADCTPSFVKIDVENYEIFALIGMLSILERSKPVVIIENANAKIQALLAPLGYTMHDLFGGKFTVGEGLPNSVAVPAERDLATIFPPLVKVQQLFSIASTLDK